MCKENAIADVRRILRPNTFLNQQAALCIRILFASTDLMRRPRSDSFLHIDIQDTYQLRMQEYKMLALGICFPQPWSSAGRRSASIKITFGLLRTTLVISTKTNSMKCLVNWIPLNTTVRLNKIRRDGFERTNMQWNPVNQAFHRICSCENEPIVW